MICIDACLAVKWLLPEEGSREALSLLKAWEKKDTALMAPYLIDFEVGSVLRQKVLRKLLHPDDLLFVIDAYHRLNIRKYPMPSLERAVQTASALSQPTIYDVSYLMLAWELDSDFVTADKRFFNAASTFFPHVKFFMDI